MRDGQNTLDKYEEICLSQNRTRERELEREKNERIDKRDREMERTTVLGQWVNRAIWVSIIRDADDSNLPCY